MSEDLKKKVESILFAAGRAVSLKELQSLLHITEQGLIKESVRELKAYYDSADSSIMILSEGDGWKLAVREGFLPLVRKINPHTELSKTIIETLAVIAWKQPALQSDVVKIRTNKAYEHISELHRLGFIAKERVGRSFLIKVTQKFLDYFDLPDDKSIKDAFKDFKDIKLAVKDNANEMSKETIDSKRDAVLVKDKSGKSVDVIGRSKESDDSAGESIDLETYDDSLPPVVESKSVTELETYMGSPQGCADLGDRAGGPEEPAEDGGEVFIPENNVGSEGNAGEETKRLNELEGHEELEKPDDFEGQEEHEETSEEKTRRIAHELVDGDGSVSKTSESDDGLEDELGVETKDKDIHPELEEFISAEEKKEGEKVVQDETKLDSVPVEVDKNKEDKEDKDDEDGGKDGIVVPDHTESEPEPKEVDKGVDDPKPAEEYPGQFDDGNDVGEDKDKKDHE